MATSRASIKELDLNTAQQAMLGEIVAALVAVNVYRQLDLQRAGDTSGCNIAGNCTSSSSKLLAEEAFE